MGHVTRLEVTQLVEKFEERLIPAQMGLGGADVFLAGINVVKHELKTTQGVPSVLLRNYARVLKHYIDLPKDPRNIHYANYVLTAVANGTDPTKAIKRARSECDPVQKQKELEKAMKQIQKRESESIAA